MSRKEVESLRGANGNENGNEAKNERLRVRWLGSAVTELQGEVAEVLRTRNASEELAERSRMRGELALLKGDVAAVGRGIRNLGGRIAKIEAVLGTIRVDIAAVKERFSLLSRTCADIASQVTFSVSLSPPFPLDSSSQPHAAFPVLVHSYFPAVLLILLSTCSGPDRSRICPLPSRSLFAGPRFFPSAATRDKYSIDGQRESRGIKDKG